MKTRTLVGLSTLALALATSILAAQASQDSQDAGEVLRKRLKDDAEDFWIYDDLEAGYARAGESGKPLLVSFRCVP